MSPCPTRSDIAGKAALAVALVTLAYWLFFFQAIGATLGGFALAWCTTAAIGVPALRRGSARIALAAALACALVLVDDPSVLAWTLFWIALATAALLPRRSFDDALSWGARLASFAVLGLAAPIRDMFVLRRAHRTAAISIGSVVAVAALPLAGTLVFGVLFAAANPLIARALDTVRLPAPGEIVARLLFCTATLVIVWPVLRPRAAALAGGLVRDAAAAIDLPVRTLTLSLATFNLVFAVPNSLDLAFLWSGAQLPEGMTLADYAHRGAYTLIATAILAGGFVLVALAPVSRAARSPAVRRLLVAWIAQNIFLVASSILRLLDYIEAYSLTALRIAAMAWMLLVAVGLALICWRLLRGRGAAWLVNANALAAALVLAVASVVDLGAVAAAWNVHHARSIDRLDLCYLHALGPSALLPLVALERRVAGPVLRDQVRYLRADAHADLAAAQADWHAWTWRGARRLAAADALASRTASLRPAPYGRGCDGRIFPPPAAMTPLPQPRSSPMPSTTPLTNRVAR